MTTTTATPPVDTFTADQVKAALRWAADEVRDAVAFSSDGGTVGMLDLLANATQAYLADPAVTLEDVAADWYEEPLETVLGWIND